MIPAEFLADVRALPAGIRAVLEAELAAGNTIVEVGHSFPAPPAGVYFRMARPISTASTTRGQIADASRFYFLLDPEPPPAPYPDMDAIRRAAQTEPSAARTKPAAGSKRAEPARVARFRASMELDYEKWKEGIGYDLDAIRGSTPRERTAIERTVLERGVEGWRDVEALAALDTPGARKALRQAARLGTTEVRMAVRRFAPKLVTPDVRIQSLIAALQTGATYGGLGETLREVAEFHPPEVMAALWEAARTREGETAVHLAAMLLFLHGKARSTFDWKHRPLFLRFHAEPGPGRDAVYHELRERCGLANSGDCVRSRNPV